MSDGTSNDESNSARSNQQSDTQESASSLSSIVLVGIDHPGKNDVMFGRGGDTNYHVGNHRFRMVADEYAERYQNGSRKQKAAVVRELVNRWRSETPPGRFLTRTDPSKGDDSLWHDVGHGAAVKKAAKVLSERCSERRAAAAPGGTRKRPAQQDSSPSPQRKQLTEPRKATPQPSTPTAPQQSSTPNASQQYFPGTAGAAFMNHQFQHSTSHIPPPLSLHQHDYAIQAPEAAARAPAPNLAMTQNFFGQETSFNTYNNLGISMHGMVQQGSQTNTSSTGWPSHLGYNADLLLRESHIGGIVEHHRLNNETANDESPPSDFEAQMALSAGTNNLPSAAALTDFFSSSGEGKHDNHESQPSDNPTTRPFRRD